MIIHFIRSIELQACLFFPAACLLVGVQRLNASKKLTDLEATSKEWRTAALEVHCTKYEF